MYRLPRTTNPTQDLDGSTPKDHEHSFDRAGNMTIQETRGGTVTRYYKHDLWNRMVEVMHGTNVVFTCKYNGLNWLIYKQSDLTGGTGGAPNGVPDQERYRFYSANWQLLQENIDDNWTSGGPNAIDRRMHYIWGIRYIDDIAMRKLDGNANGSFNDSVDKAYYHLTNVQFSTLAVIDHAGTVLENGSFSEYGIADFSPGEDLNNSRTVTSADLTIVTSNYATHPAAGDVNRDGDVDLTDRTLVGSAIGVSMVRGQLSKKATNGGTDNIIGWCGYVFNPEVEMYTVRFRWYEPGIGRWVERDPLGSTRIDQSSGEVTPWIAYTDSMVLYSYAANSPLSRLDPTGLEYATVTGPYGPVWRCGTCYAFVVIDYNPSWYDYVNPLYDINGPTPQQIKYYPLPLDCNECKGEVIKKIFENAGDKIGTYDSLMRDQILSQLMKIEGIEEAFAAAWNNSNVTMMGALQECMAVGLIGTVRLAKGVRNTLEPGPHAGGSVPAQGRARPTVEQQKQINALGAKHGCHTCGSKRSGTESGNWIGDHQPPRALNPEGKTMDLYPQCITCSQSQGGTVRAVKHGNSGVAGE